MPFCTKCGNQIAEDMLFCTSCGNNTQNQDKFAKKRKSRKKIILSTIALIFMILIVYLGVKHFKQYRTIKNHDFIIDQIGSRYQLSQLSKNSVNQLENNMFIRAYFSDNLPQDLFNVKLATLFLLKEYQVASNGRFKFELIDLRDNNQLQEEAKQKGVLAVNVQVRNEDSLTTLRCYLGLVFNYDGKIESIPLVQTTKGLEYEITSVINKLSTHSMSNVAFYGLTPDMPDNQDRFQHAKERIRSQYNLINTNLNQPIVEDIDILVFPGITGNLSNMQLYNLDQFLMGGNNILIFQDRINADLQSQTAYLIESNIFGFLSNYGIDIKENLVMDAECSQVNVQQRQGVNIVNIPIKYPFFPLTNNVNSRHSIVNQLSNLQFVFVSEIDITKVAFNLTFTSLIYTSNNSSTIIGPNFEIGILQFQDKAWMNNLSPNHRAITGIYEGMFTSFFTDKDIPFKDDNFVKEAYGKLIVVPDMDFISSQGAGSNQSNMDFLMNAIHYLLGYYDLIEMQYKEVVLNLPEHQN